MARKSASGRSLRAVIEFSHEMPRAFFCVSCLYLWSLRVLRAKCNGVTMYMSASVAQSKT